MKIRDIRRKQMNKLPFELSREELEKEYMDLKKVVDDLKDEMSNIELRVKKQESNHPIDVDLTYKVSCQESSVMNKLLSEKIEAILNSKGFSSKSLEALNIEGKQKSYLQGMLKKTRVWDVPRTVYFLKKLKVDLNEFFNEYFNEFDLIISDIRNGVIK